MQVLVDQGLLGHHSDMRNAFKEALLFVCLNVKQNELPEAPAFFFLRVLLEKLQFMTTVDPMNTLQYFELFSQLMRRYFEEVAATDNQAADKAPTASNKLFDESSLLHEVLRLVE